MRGLGLRLGLTRYGVGGVGAPPAVITAPVLAFAAARPAGSTFNFGAGGNCNITIDATVGVGMYWNVEIASNTGFTTPLSGEGAIRTELKQIVAQDFITGPEFVSCLSLPNGLTYMRVWVTDDSGRASANSNTLTDTIASAVAKFHTTNGANKHSDSTVSISDLRVSSVDGNGINCVRNTLQPAADETQFEFTVVAVGAFDHGVYIEDGTTVLGPSTFAAPTVGNNAIRISMHNSFDNSIQGGDSGANAFFGNPDPGDVWSIVIKKSTKTIKIYHTPISTGVTTLRATKTVAGSNFYVACQARSTGGIFDFNFGATAFLRPLDVGVVAYNG